MRQGIFKIVITALQVSARGNASLASFANSDADVVSTPDLDLVPEHVPRRVAELVQRLDGLALVHEARLPRAPRCHMCQKHIDCTAADRDKAGQHLACDVVMSRVAWKC